MNILVITSVFPYPNKPNCGTYVYDFCKQLSKEQDINVEVLSVPIMSFSNQQRMACKYRKHIITESFIVNQYPQLFFSSRIFQRATVNKFSHRIKEMIPMLSFRPDLIVCHFSFPTGFATIKLKKELEVPIVIIEHHSIYLSKRISNYIVRNTIKEIKESTKVICVSEHLRKGMLRCCHKFKELDDNSIVVIPNVIDSCFQYKKRIKSDSTVFLSVGNLIKSKGMVELVEAFYSEFNENSGKVLIIVGTGPEKSKIEKIIKEKKIKNVLLEGGVSHDRMPEYYHQAHFFCLLSKFETFGIVYREAAISGCLILSLRNDGVLLDWDDSMGILIDSRTQADIRKGLRELASKYDETSIIRNSKRLREKYSNNIIQQYISLFMDLINRKSDI